MKKFEYAALYFRRGKFDGRSAGHYDTLEGAKRNNTFCSSDEKQKFFRRDVGEMEKDEMTEIRITPYKPLFYIACWYKVQYKKSFFRIGRFVLYHWVTIAKTPEYEAAMDLAVKANNCFNSKWKEDSIRISLNPWCMGFARMEIPEYRDDSEEKVIDE